MECRKKINIGNGWGCQVGVISSWTISYILCFIAIVCFPFDFSILLFSFSFLLECVMGCLLSAEP